MSKELHADILRLIKEKSGTPTKHTFSDAYLGNNHVRYPITIPVLRSIAKDWMLEHAHLTSKEFASLISMLIQAPSSTEKTIAGIMLGYSHHEQRKFNPDIFNNWLDHLNGWAKVDAVCTGDFSITQIQSDWTRYKKLLIKLSKDENLNKRRASLVLLCSPLSKLRDDSMAETALQIVDRLKSEKAVLITKVISWLLRSMVRHYAKTVSLYIKENNDTLPKIAIRETVLKLKTGKKSKPISSAR